MKELYIEGIKYLKLQKGLTDFFNKDPRENYSRYSGANRKA